MSTPPIPTVPATGARAPPDGAGCVLWHRRNLRITDHPALAYAAREYDTVVPVFVFDPAFYGPDGLACDARIKVLHESLASLGRLYEAVGGSLSLAHGDAVEVLGRVHEAGWDVVATADPTASYGADRDDRAATRCDVTFVDGDGLVRDETWTRDNWSDRVEAWFEADPPTWDTEAVTFEPLETQVTIEAVEDAYDIEPTKSNVPAGGRGPAVRKLRAFVENIGAYPGNISAPTDARTGTSQLSPHLRFGSLSVREVYQYVQQNAPEGTGREMFVSRLFWNKHSPYPVVEYEAARERAMEKYERLKPDALAALKDPEVARRASLSARSRPQEDREGGSEPDRNEQASLGSFSPSDGEPD